ncbi:MAG: protein kinase, partial [Chloroflexi bacterium]|nr:protein kinase [Chloroflexota bacterium]
MSTNSLIGRTIGKYKIVQHLGRGGMAEVYKAYHENLDRHVAIKLMHPFLADDKEFLARFKREARAMAAISHPNIIDVFDFDVEGDTYYIVMEYISGGTLKELIEHLAANGQRMELSRAIQLILELADALTFAHSRGMLHRDIKPANIMLNERDSAILTDFGIAKMMSGPSHTATGAMIGTPAYMSPEQGLGQPGDERSDLYSLGVLFYQLVTGKLPYDADTPLAVVLKHVNEPLPDPRTLNPNLPTAFEDILFKALAKKPADRYSSVHEFARELRQAVRRSTVDLGTALPAALLQDKPTPLPSQTAGSAGIQTAVKNDDGTLVANPFEATMVASGGDATQFAPAGGATAVFPTPTAPPAGRRWLPWAIGLIILLALGAGGIFALGGDDVTPTPT